MNRIEPPEDLRAKIAGHIDDYATYLQEYSDLNRSALLEHTDTILALCEAAALAALPEKQEQTMPHQSKEDYETARDRFYRVGGFNFAIATAQANIHSVFGGE